MSGWNGSDSGRARTPSAPQKPVKSGGVSPALLKGALGGLAVVVAALAVFFIFGRVRTPSASQGSGKKSAAIKAVTPAAAPTNRVAVAKPEKKVPFWKLPTTNGLSEAQIRKWEFMHQPPPSYTNRTLASYPKPAFAIFDTRAENEIACLISIKPGAALFGTPRYYNEKFKQEFLKSCETPIIVTKEDDEFHAQLKRDMNATKIELMERIRNGEDLGEILLETRKEIQRLAQVKRAVEKDMRAMIRESAASEADVDSCIEAANKLLESKGIAPVKMNPILRRALIRSINEKPVDQTPAK